MTITVSRRPRTLALIASTALTSALLAAVQVSEPAAAAPLPSNCTPNGAQVTCTFSYTGAVQTWTVPAGVNAASVVLEGAQGGAPQDLISSGVEGGRGARVTATLTGLVAGERYEIRVGGAGGPATGGYNGGGTSELGGGGGGGTDIRKAGAALNARRIVAGGGGGAGAGSVGCPPTCLGKYGAGGPSDTMGGDGGADGQALGGRAGYSGTYAGSNGGTSPAGAPGSDGQIGQGGDGGGVLGVHGRPGGGGGGGLRGGGGGGAGQRIAAACPAQPSGTRPCFGGGGGGGGGTSGQGGNVIDFVQTQGVVRGNGFVTITYNRSTTPALQVSGVPVLPGGSGQVTLTATMPTANADGTVAFSTVAGPLPGCASRPMTLSGGVFTATCDAVFAARLDGSQAMP